MDDDRSLPHHAVFFEREDADAVARALGESGFGAVIDRIAFAGEDNDEDHSWAVWTDAPHVMLELAADEFDGWVVYDRH